MKQKNYKKIKWIYLILILAVSISVLSMYAWAKYMSKVTGNATASIAHFSFNVSEQSSDDLTINLASTRDKNDTQSVDRSTVAPGTKGTLQFDINADISDVSLKYNIDIDLTNVPQNLIFYYDESMTNAIYYSGEILNINGFFSAGTQNKTDTKIVYWSWPIETGQTQEQIDANDLIDSNYMGSNVTIDIHVTGEQVKSNPTEGECTVTFDANGGAIKGYGNSEKMTKSVIYGEVYGELPVPERDGYQFAGWNGKNMINLDLYNIENEFLKIADGKIIIQKVDEKVKYIGERLEGLIDGNIYSISAKVEGEFEGRIYGFFGASFWGVNNGGYSFRYSATDDKGRFYIFQNDENDIVNMKILSNSVVLSDIQLEEGGTRTEFEPYYVTETTKVTRENNHTLKAIWIKETE